MVTIRRINGKDNSVWSNGDYKMGSNMITGVSYTGTLDNPLKVGSRVWLWCNGVYFVTSPVRKLKDRIFRTEKAVYEIIYRHREKNNRNSR